jgi:hypothetical protein
MSKDDNVVSHKIDVGLGDNESASLDRPAWTSEPKTGMFKAYKHKHGIIRGAFRLVKNFFSSD